MDNSPTAWLTAARATMDAEAGAIRTAAGRLNGTLVRAVELIVAQRGKLVVSGLGKSGLVGQKIAATLCSTGTPAVFLHPAEAVHGDLGVCAPGDPSILISKSGTTAELLRLVPLLRDLESPLIGILGNNASPLAAQMDVVLDGTVQSEADPCQVAPTSSAVVALALGDALASALMCARQFTVADYARFHPGGQLGRNLTLTVREAMHREAAWVGANDTLKQVVVAMTHQPLGAACVVDNARQLLGMITDGDLRRALQAHDDIRALRACDIMSRTPTTIHPAARLTEALRLMEDRPSQISVLPVVEADGCCAGVLRLHDIYHPTSNS